MNIKIFFELIEIITFKNVAVGTSMYYVEYDYERL